MSYENENETKTDWFEVAYLMTRCGMFGFGYAIFFAVMIVLGAQYEAVMNDGIPFDSMVIACALLASLLGGTASCIMQWLESR